jgi:cell division protein FtsI/penicillin-binding protein 2
MALSQILNKKNMLKKILFRLFLIFIIAFIGIIVYLFNAEKFYPEFYLQNRLGKVVDCELANKYSPDSLELRYKFYDSSGIDVEVSISGNGIVIIGQNTWYWNSENKKYFKYEIEREIAQELIASFRNQYQESESFDADYKLGGTYAELIYNNELTVGFYNTTPHKDFKRLKRRILKIAFEIIK